MTEVRSRREKYRLAGKTFRFGVYLFLDASMAGLLALIGAELLGLIDFNPSVALGLAVCLALISLAHYGRTALTRPWLALKAVLIAAIALGITLVTTELDAWLVSLAVFSVSFWIIGESDVGKTAAQNLGKTA